MRRRDLLAASAALAAATPALASAPKKEGGDKSVGQYVDLPMTAIPVLDGKKLKNYVFVALRLNLAANADALKQREKAPYYRDAVVRAAHRVPMNPPGKWSVLDEPRFRAAVLAEAQRIAGPGVVASVTINSATPQRRM